MQIQCIALDLDQTTLDETGLLSSANRAALEHAIARGIHIVIASGRPFGSLPKAILDIPGIEYAITSNGAAIYTLPDAVRLHSYLLAPDAVQSILQLTAHEPVVYEVFISGIAYAYTPYVEDPVRYGAAPQAIGYIQRTRHPVEDMPAFIREHIHELDSLDIIVNDESVRSRIWSVLEENIPDIYITSSVRQLIEISHKDAGKHSGVRFVAEQLGIPPEQIAAFGDGDNDADMLVYVGCGIAVANASPACMAAADCVTLDYREDGVAHGIYHILRI